MCEWMSCEANPRHPESFKRKYVAIRGENMLLLLLLKIKGSVTLLSQVQVIIPKEYRHGVFECVMKINGAGRVARVSMRSNICVTDNRH